MLRGIKRRAAALTVVAAIALAVTACSSGATPAATSSAGSQEDVTLSMWTFLDPNAAADPRGTALKNIVDDYNAQSKHIKVEVRSINYATIDSEVI